MFFAPLAQYYGAMNSIKTAVFVHTSYESTEDTLLPVSSIFSFY